MISQAAQKDIQELKDKIQRFKEGKMPEERFRAFRLARGVYGQRQIGVQMLRIKIPFGRITSEQLIRMADISEEYTNGNLHLTTRQNIQMHHIKLDDSPAIWVKLEEKGITAREACGNTVRTVTGSAKAGIDPEELFDISPYAHEISYYFLRNPVCQEMGRKFKMAFSSSDKDSAFGYFHDLGFIPRIQTNEKGETKRGFKVVLGGGLGAQAMVAYPIYDFLPEEELIPLAESVIRVFDRYGERERRHKARLKFLLNGKRAMGVEKFMELVEAERKSLPYQSYWINRDIVKENVELPDFQSNEPIEVDTEAFEFWQKANTFEQKQKGFYSVQIKLHLGNIDADRARQFAKIVKKYAADDIRITVNQGFLLRYIRPKALPFIYQELAELGLADAGFDSIADITACPGTDTCNLAVSDSTHLSTELEKVIQTEYLDLILDSDIKIKISGCMNGCGQHIAANIGLHGSSIRKKPYVIPAMQVVLGGGVDPTGKGYIAEKVIKLPTRRIPNALRTLLDDYNDNALEGEYYNDYFQRLGKRYFYTLLKPLADTSEVLHVEYIDWGAKEFFQPAIGVGECAGVTYDMVSTIIADAEEKLDAAQATLKENVISAHTIYHAYNTFVVGAKALLLSIDVKCNTQIGILKDFDTHFVQTGKFDFPMSFEEYVLRLRKNEPTEDFARQFVADAALFLAKVKSIRATQIAADQEQLDKVVVDSFYRA